MCFTTTWISSILVSESMFPWYSFRNGTHGCASLIWLRPATSVTLCNPQYSHLSLGSFGSTLHVHADGKNAQTQKMSNLRKDIAELRASPAMRVMVCNSCGFICIACNGACVYWWYRITLVKCRPLPFLRQGPVSVWGFPLKTKFYIVWLSYVTVVYFCFTHIICISIYMTYAFLYVHTTCVCACVCIMGMGMRMCVCVRCVYTYIRVWVWCVLNVPC